MSDSTTAWVFVSHASQDLAAVRKVRNYLEEQGAAPLLFHLLSLRQSEAFWPIIEQEIAERNFFLYCESKAAEASPWVQRERRAVENALKQRPIRIGRVRVDSEKLDLESLARFVQSIRVYPSFSMRDKHAVAPFVATLRGAGFIVLGDAPDDASTLMSQDDWWETLSGQIADTVSSGGWQVLFWSQSSRHSRMVQDEILENLRLGGRLVIVALDRTPLDALAPVIHADKDAPQRLRDMLLTMT